ncbi:lipopolysaccharide biosynthesis protein [Sporosarcina sp. ITBMC105]
MKNAFMKHVLTLMKGTAIAQFLPVLISPILTRMYTPEEFGIFAIYIAVISVLTPIVSGRYELAIALPKEERKALSLFTLTIIINLCVTLVAIIFILFTADRIVDLLSLQDSVWLYLLPIGLFLVGIFNSLTYLNNRHGRFGYLAKSKINQSIAMAVSQLFLGIIKLGSIGLLIGYCIGQISSILKLREKIEITTKVKKDNINKKDLLSISKEYNEFPKYSMITHSTEALSTNIPNLLFSKFFGTQYTGYYSLTTRTINLPMSLIGRSVGDVFLSTASKLYRENGNCKDIYIKTLKILAIIPVVPFIFLFLYAEGLFAFVFGEEWRIAGSYARILIPALYVQFIASPLSHMFIIAKKVKLEFFIQVIILILSVLSFIIGYYYFNSTVISLRFFSGVLILKYSLFMLLSYRFAANNVEGRKTE